mgnify:FL=1
MPYYFMRDTPLQALEQLMIPWRIWATMWSACARRGRTGTMTCGQSGAKRKPRQHKAVGVNSFIQHQLPIQRLLF